MSEEKCYFCGAHLQDRPVCRVCGCSLDFDTETEAKSIRINSHVAKNLHLPIFEVPQPEKPKAPPIFGVGPNLKEVFE